jgi:hypothetical protein
MIMKYVGAFCTDENHAGCTNFIILDEYPVDRPEAIDISRSLKLDLSDRECKKCRCVVTYSLKQICHSTSRDGKDNRSYPHA